MTGVEGSSAALDAEQVARLGRGHRRALHQRRPAPRPGATSSSLCCTGPAAGIHEVVLHPDAQVTAGRQGRRRDRQVAAPDPGGRPASSPAGGSSATPASSAAGVPGIPPGTPVTKSTCTLPPNGSPSWSSSRRSAATWPRSNSSNSGTTSRSSLAVQLDHERPGVEEHVVAEVRRAAGERARVGLGVEHGEPLVQRVVRPSRRSTAARPGRSPRARASTAARRQPGSRVGAWSASRMCRWIIDAPAASQRTAVSTSSSSVVGSCGTSPCSTRRRGRDGDEGVHGPEPRAARSWRDPASRSEAPWGRSTGRRRPLGPPRCRPRAAARRRPCCA